MVASVEARFRNRLSSLVERSNRSWVRRRRKIHDAVNERRNRTHFDRVLGRIARPPQIAPQRSMSREAPAG